MSPPAEPTPRRIGRPPLSDDGPSVAVTVRLPAQVVAQLDGVLTLRQRTEPDVTRQDILREAVNRYLAPRRRTGASAKPRRAGGTPQRTPRGNT